MFAWFLTSKVGRTIIAVGAAALAALGVVAHVFNAGRRREKQKAVDNTLRHVEKKRASDEAVDRLPADARRDRLRKWSRD